MGDDARVPIESDADLVPARARARALAEELGFSPTDATLIATAVSEIARNIVSHVGLGEIVMTAIVEPDRRGLRVVASDDGPGIGDVDQALEHGYTSRRGLGLGLSGARRLMDEFDIASSRMGTRVTMTKWRVLDELERLRERRDSRPTGPS